jgi:phage-related protein
VKRKIVFYGDYFLDFYSKQDVRTKEKIDFVLDLIRNVERVPTRFLKFLLGTEGLYEIKIISNNKSIRIFCFFDENQLIILLNSFNKKTAKTPKQELIKAMRLKNNYFTEKSIRKNK